MELKLKAQNVARIETRAKSTRVPSALLAASEKSKPTRSIPQGIFFTLSKASQTVYKSLSNLINPPPSSLAWKAHEHGVPTGLFRLPLEIREQIYGLVTGYKTVLKIPENYHKLRPSRGRSDNGSTSLLRTCRQIYAEASTSIYTQNTFHFQNHNDFLAFAHAVNPVFLSHITSLNFDLNSILRVDGDPYGHQCPCFTVNLIDGVKPQWSHVWTIIAAMDNLIELKVFLQDPGFPERDGMQCLCLPESEILSALWKVKRSLRVFEMDVPWVDTSSWGSLKSSQPITEGAPFNLTRRGINPIPRSRHQPHPKKQALINQAYTIAPAPILDWPGEGTLLFIEHTPMFNSKQNSWGPHLSQGTCQQNLPSLSGKKLRRTDGEKLSSSRKRHEI